jgi:hypothetical protein
MSIDKKDIPELDIPEQQLKEPINQLEQEIVQLKRGVENIVDSDLINVKEYAISTMAPLKHIISSGNFTCEKLNFKLLKKSRSNELNNNKKTKFL